MTKTYLFFQVCISGRPKGVLGAFIDPHLHLSNKDKDGKDTCKCEHQKHDMLLSM